MDSFEARRNKSILSEYRTTSSRIIMARYNITFQKLKQVLKSQVKDESEYQILLKTHRDRKQLHRDR